MLYTAVKNTSEGDMNMNLKEAFRFQNKLESLMTTAEGILEDDRNITTTVNTHLRKKVMPEAENEETVQIAPSEYADRINDVVEFLLYLLHERERLSAAIRSAKAALDIDFDAAVSLNKVRQYITGVFREMTDLRPSEQTIPNGGYGYRFNTDGNQITYKCDLRQVTTINFDRNTVRRHVTALSKEADEVSAKLDAALVNTPVGYEAPFDVGDTFADVFEEHLSRKA